MDDYGFKDRPPLPVAGSKPSGSYGQGQDYGPVGGTADSRLADLLRSRQQEALSYRNSGVYADYQAYVRDGIDKIFLEMNDISKSAFGIELKKPNLAFEVAISRDAYAYAQYVPETNTIIVYDSPTFRTYLDSQKGSIFRRSNYEVLKTIGHELGHELINKSYLVAGHKVSPLFADVERRLQIEESTAEVIGYYASMKAQGLPVDNVSVAKAILGAAAIAGYHNAEAIDSYIKAAKEKMQGGFDPAIAAKFITLVGAADHMSFDADTKYLFPSVALAKALVGTNGMPLEQFISKLFEDPNQFKDVKEFLNSKDYTAEVVRRFVDMRQREVDIMREEYAKMKQADAAKNEAFDPNKPLISQSVLLTMRVEYRVAMEFAQKLSVEFHDLELRAETALKYMQPAQP